MATATTNLALRKPDTTDLINVATDLNQNFDKIDVRMTPRFSVSKTRTAGSYVLNGTSWGDLDNPTWETTFPATAGDLIEVTLAFLWGAEATDAYVNVVTIVAATPTNSLTPLCALTGTTGSGYIGLIGSSGVARPASGSLKYKVVAGDITAGNITLRIRWRTNTAVNKTIFGVVGIQMQADFVNFGQ